MVDSWSACRPSLAKFVAILLEDFVQSFWYCRDPGPLPVTVTTRSTLSLPSELLNTACLGLSNALAGLPWVLDLMTCSTVFFRGLQDLRIHLYQVDMIGRRLAMPRLAARGLSMSYPLIHKGHVL